MTCCPFPCQKSNPLTWLMCPVHVTVAVKVLSEKAQQSRSSLSRSFLEGSHGEECVKVLMQLLKSHDMWLCSTALHILGVLLETETMVQKLQEWTDVDNDVCRALGQLLSKDEPDVVLNAAGAVASLVETSSGRQWLLQDLSVLDQLLEKVAYLLGHERETAVNSAALILARLCLCDMACNKLLAHSSAFRTLSRLAQCLIHSQTDTAMNAAFTIGRLCGSESGRSLILAVAKEYKLASSLQALLCSRAGPEAAQTACFALSCLASEDDVHALLMDSPSFPALLNGLLSLLKSGEPDSTWFAAMTVRVFVSRPAGVIGVREHGSLEEQLKCLSLSASTGPELQEELSACLRKLKRLPKPSPIKVQHLQSGACKVSWEKLEPESGLEVTYSLLDGDTVLYRGSQCQMTLPQSQFQAKQSLSLHLSLSTSDSDTSPFSEPVEVTVENTNIKPGAPRLLRVTVCTATQVRLSWMEPKGAVKATSFQVYCDDVLVETTTELGSTVNSLSPNTTYLLSVCALGPGDTAGPQSCLTVQTDEGQDHTPSGLAVAVLGRHELHISWGAPATPLGRLFNYELRLNGRVVYLGTERSHTARHLSPNTAYTCTVTAITSRGRCQSRPVTKRTARIEYLNTTGCLYSPTRLATSQPLPSPPVAREMAEVQTKVRRPLLPRRHLSEVPLPVHHLTDPDLRKDRHRLPSVSVQSHTTEKSRSNLTSGVQKLVGRVSELDLNTVWNSEKKGFGCRSESCEPFLPPCNSAQECPEPIPRPQCQPSSTLELTHPREKTSPAMLLQWGSGRTASDRGKLPLIRQKITERVKLLQPVAYNWPDLDQTHHNKTHRNRLTTRPRVHGHVKERHYLTQT